MRSKIPTLHIDAIYTSILYIPIVNDRGMETPRGTDQGYAGVGVRV